MTSKNFKTSTNSLLDGIPRDSENSYENYLRKKYGVPNDCEILIKQGFVAKDNSNSQNLELTQRGKLLEAQFRMYKLIYDEVRD